MSLCDGLGSGALIVRGYVVPILGIEMNRNSSRVDEIAEQHRKMAALAIGGLRGVAAGGAAPLAESAAPQSPQNRLSPGLSASHFGQRFVSATPQSPQNFLLGGFSVLQFEQRISRSSPFKWASIAIVRTN